MSIQNTSPLPEASLYRERSSDQRLKSPKRAVPDLDVRVASSLKEVIECWKLVYESYQRIDIVDDNPTGVHTHPHAIRPSTSVVVGRLDKTPVSTLTIMHDCPRYGLPLDRVFNRQLNLLRRLGRPIVEVGLFADRHEVAGRALASIMEMMRFVYWNACFHGADVLCGVHPHHAGFYIKTFGFDLIGPVLPYAAVRGKPVVLLRVSTVNHLRQERLPRGLEMFHQNRLSPTAFDERFTLSPETIDGTIIGNSLRHRGLLTDAGLTASHYPIEISEPMQAMPADSDQSSAIAA